jgi:hypothetical protein
MNAHQTLEEKTLTQSGVFELHSSNSITIDFIESGNPAFVGKKIKYNIAISIKRTNQINRSQSFPSKALAEV